MIRVFVSGVLLAAAAISFGTFSQTITGQRLTDAEVEAIGEPKSVIRRSDSREDKIEWVRQNAMIPRADEGESPMSVAEKIEQAGGKIVVSTDDHIIASGAAEDFLVNLSLFISLMKASLPGWTCTSAKSNDYKPPLQR